MLEKGQQKDKRSLQFTFWNSLIVSWLTPLFVKGSQKPLEMYDLPTLPKDYQGSELQKQVQDYFNKPLEHRGSFGHFLVKQYWHLGFVNLT